MPTQANADPHHTPERDLLACVVQLAVEDLESSSGQDRYEAWRFWSEKDGPWARSRRDLLAAVGLDEDATLQRLRPRIEAAAPADGKAPERRIANARDLSWEVVLQAIGEDEVVNAKTMAARLNVSWETAANRLYYMREKGILLPLGRGRYQRASGSLVPAAVHRLTKKPSLEHVILFHLTQGPKTALQLLWAVEGEVSKAAIQNILGSLEARGIVYRNGQEWTTAPQLSVAANR